MTGAVGTKTALSAEKQCLRLFLGEAGIFGFLTEVLLTVTDPAELLGRTKTILFPHYSHMEG